MDEQPFDWPSFRRFLRFERYRMAIRGFASCRLHWRRCWKRTDFPLDLLAAVRRSAEQDVRRARAELVAALEEMT